MRTLVVATGLDQLADSARRHHFISSLSRELAESGLGHLPDLDSLGVDAGEACSCPAEIAVELLNLDHGRELIRRVSMDAGIEPRLKHMPERWRCFGCSDYFSSAMAEHGYWDEAAQYWYVWPSDQIYELPDLEFLVIGGPGVDGVDWGYRAGHEGVWTYYPIGREFVWLVPTVDALMRGWRSGNVKV
jgi:hypothetical protein